MKRKGQAILEYTTLIVIVAMALLAMQVYFKRGLQGKLRGNADDLSGAGVYAPAATNSFSTITKDIEEETSSYTIKDDGAAGDLNERSVSKSSAAINQTTERDEEVLPLGAKTQGAVE